MDAKGRIGLAIVCLLAAALSACGSSRRGNDISRAEIQSDESDSTLPARYGLYAVEDGQLGRLDGEKNFQVETWESRSRLDSDVRFIIFDRSLGDRTLRLGDAIMLRRVAHVRNDVAASGAATPLQQDTWVVADLPELAVPVDFRPIAGSPEMVEVIPIRPLPPGLYSLQLRLGDSSIAGRFGVKWSTIDRAQYAAANCVDRYAGSSPRYKVCSDLSAQAPQQQIYQQPLQPFQQQQPLQQQAWPQQNTLQHQLIQPYKTPPAVAQAPEQPAPKQQALQQQPQETQQATQVPSAQGLKLRDVKAARTMDQGVAILTVEGVIANPTNEPRRLPPLMATVRDLKGTQLDRWTFTAEIPVLPPGGTTGFRTETIYPTNQSTNVAVTFASDSTAQAQ